MFGSALLYAVVHDRPLSIPAIMAIGMAAAWGYKRTWLRWAAMAAQVVYNGILMGLAGR